MMVIVDQCWSVLDNVDQCWSMLTVLINVHQCWPVLISVGQCCSMLITGDQYRSVLFDVGVDECWPRLINVNQWWMMLANVDQCRSMLTNIDQCCSEKQNHWKFINFFKGFEVFGDCKSDESDANSTKINGHGVKSAGTKAKHWKSAKIDENEGKIKGNQWHVNGKSIKVFENRWKIDEYRCQSMRIRENQWKSKEIDENQWFGGRLLVAPGPTIDIDPGSVWLIFGRPGLP